MDNFDQALELFSQFSPTDQKIVIELLKLSLTLGTVDLYKIIEEFENYSSGLPTSRDRLGSGTADLF
jgi:hypothetical protein